MEIERKFVGDMSLFPFDINSCPYADLTQYYISLSPTIRIRQSDDEYILTVKGPGAMAREEYELSLSKKQYENLLKKAETPAVSKRRFFYPLDGGLTAEIDLYNGPHEGLVVIEVEFPDIDSAESFVPPDWFGREVTGDRRYKNTNLAAYGLPAEKITG